MMQIRNLHRRSVLLLVTGLAAGSLLAQKVDPSTYLDPVRAELEKAWPENRTINLVFHGHSVPSGYFDTPMVHTLEAYPNLTLGLIKEAYPLAVVNVITTAIGGENSEEGAARFEEDVLCHKPDVLFIDYGLNDRSIGIDRARIAWRSMISMAEEKGTRVILMTPTPDTTENILDPAANLASYSRMIRLLSVEHGVGLVDSYARFRKIAGSEALDGYMSQFNHVNEAGHREVAALIFEWFRP